MRTLRLCCAAVVLGGFVVADASACPVVTSAVLVQAAPLVVQAVQPAPVVVQSTPVAAVPAPVMTTLAVPTVTVLSTPVVTSPVIVEQVVRVKTQRQYRTPVRNRLFR